MFEKLKVKLSDEYRAYADKGKLCAKQDNLKSAYQSVMRDLRYTQVTYKGTGDSDCKAVVSACGLHCEM